MDQLDKFRFPAPGTAEFAAMRGELTEAAGAGDDDALLPLAVVLVMEGEADSAQAKVDEWAARDRTRDHAAAMWSVGERLRGRTRQEQASMLMWLRRTADLGNVEAMFRMGSDFTPDGDFTAEDWDDRIRWLRGAAVAGRADAACSLARLLAEVGDHEEAVRWYRVAAAAGDQGVPDHSFAHRVGPATVWLELADALAELEDLESDLWVMRAAATGFSGAVHRAAQLHADLDMFAVARTLSLPLAEKALARGLTWRVGLNDEYKTYRIEWRIDNDEWNSCLDSLRLLAEVEMWAGNAGQARRWLRGYSQHRPITVVPGAVELFGGGRVAGTGTSRVLPPLVKHLSTVVGAEYQPRLDAALAAATDGPGAEADAARATMMLTWLAQECLPAWLVASSAAHSPAGREDPDTGWGDSAGARAENLAARLAALPQATYTEDIADPFPLYRNNDDLRFVSTAVQRGAAQYLAGVGGAQAADVSVFGGHPYRRFSGGKETQLLLSEEAHALHRRFGSGQPWWMAMWAAVGQDAEQWEEKWQQVSCCLYNTVVDTVGTEGAYARDGTSTFGEVVATKLRPSLVALVERMAVVPVQPTT